MPVTLPPPAAIVEPPAIKPTSPGSRLKKVMPAADIRMQLAELRTRLALGESDVKIAEMMGLSVDAYNQLKREFYRQEVLEINNRPAEQVFIDYALRQSQNIKDLDVFIEDAKKRPASANAFVGAIRARSDIQDKIIQMGQTMGVIEKIPERKTVVHGVIIANLDNDGLRKMIANELSQLGSIISRFGDVDMAGRPIVSAAAVALPDGLPTNLEAIAPDFSAEGKPSRASASGKSVAGRASSVVRRKA